MFPEVQRQEIKIDDSEFIRSHITPSYITHEEQQHFNDDFYLYTDCCKFF